MWNTASSSWTSAVATVLLAALALAIVAGSSPCRDDGDSPPQESGGGSPLPSSSIPDVRPVVGLVPSEDPAVTRAIADGARRVFDDARKDGGPALTLVVGAEAGRWASAGAETVRLACDERVVALIGPPERTLAHPVAQAATRCRVPMLSTSPAVSVTAAGSRWVRGVVPPGDRAALTLAEAETAGRDAASVVVGVVRRAGLARDAFLAEDVTAVSRGHVAPR